MIDLAIEINVTNSAFVYYENFYTLSSSLLSFRIGRQLQGHLKVSFVILNEELLFYKLFIC